MSLFAAMALALPAERPEAPAAVQDPPHHDQAIHAFATHAHTAFAQAAPCWPNAIPLGALPGQPQPVWCYDPPETGPATLVSGANSWLDEFNHGLSLADLGPGYRAFDMRSLGEPDRLNRVQNWRHADHWMVDVNGRDQSPADGPFNFGGATMRPDRAFRAINGRLVVEADAAAGIADYGGVAWPEITVTTAPAPTGTVDVLYGYGIFRGHWTLGCRLESHRGPICALFDDTGRTDEQGGRRFETPFHVGSIQLWGGGPYTPETNAAWRVCRGTDPDTNCRDRFRLELTRDTLTLFVNGARYFEASQMPPDKQLDQLLSRDLYVYFASWVAKPQADTVRFHWDRLAVNPSTPPGPAPGAPSPSSPAPATPSGPRPQIGVTAVPDGPGRLRVTVASPSPLREIRFGAAANALIDAGNRIGATGNFTVALPSGTSQTTFFVRRAATGQGTTVPLVVVDAYGDWPTFVGGGPTAF